MSKLKLQTKDAAKILDVTGTRVMQLEKLGQLRAERTSGGIRLFDQAEVEKLARERKAAKK